MFAMNQYLFQQFSYCVEAIYVYFIFICKNAVFN